MVCGMPSPRVPNRTGSGESGLTVIQQLFSDERITPAATIGPRTLPAPVESGGMVSDLVDEQRR